MVGASAGGRQESELNGDRISFARGKALEMGLGMVAQQRVCS